MAVLWQLFSHNRKAKAMKRIKITSVAATATALVLCLLVGAASARNSSAASVRPAHAFGVQKAKPAAVSCAVTKVTITTGHASATGGCKYVRSHKPAPVLRWAYSVAVSDPMGHCSVTPATGKTKSFTFQPATAYKVSVTFQVFAKTGKAKSSPKSATRINPTSTDACSGGLTLTTTPAAADPAKAYCTLVGDASWGSTGLRVPTIGCPVNWGCKIAPEKLSQSRNRFTLWNAAQVSCAITNPGTTKGFYAYQELTAYFSDGKQECAATFDEATQISFTSLKGSILWQLTLWTTRPDPTNPAGETSHGESYVFAGGPSNGYYSGWVPVKGQIDPCTSLGWPNYTPPVNP